MSIIVPRLDPLKETVLMNVFDGTVAFTRMEQGTMCVEADSTRCHVIASYVTAYSFQIYSPYLKARRHSHVPSGPLIKLTI
jgi:hypothetical protein